MNDSWGREMAVASTGSVRSSPQSYWKGQRFFINDVNRLFQTHQVMGIREMHPQSTARSLLLMNLVYFFGSSCFTLLELNMATWYCLTTNSQ